MSDLAERRKDLVTSMMKEAIYEAAVDVLTEYGTNGVTMDRVAEQAGVAKGSLYNYFPNKLALLQFVHEKTVEPLREKAQRILHSDLPATHKLEAIIRTWFESIDEHRGVFVFLFMDLTARELLKSEEASGRAEAVEMLATIIAQGIEENVFRPGDPNRMAWLLYGTAKEMCDLQLTAGNEWPIEQLIRDVIDFFLHGVAAAGARAPRATKRH
ncbi:MAG: TetR/AcrR family transcriptional regulator [Pirellulales bacterium]|nr:TetR/AcrR family transcriptional regulator [Pirellulales bacterium]